MQRDKVLKRLAEWIESLKEDAKKDNCFSIAWFGDTKDEPFSIISGWMEGFSEDYSDFVCVSKADPNYALCLKIAVNKGPYAYTDFEIMDMPIDKFGEVDNTCLVLEYNDNADSLAEFLLGEWERITKEQKEIHNEEN